MKLGDAVGVYVGTTAASAVYLGSTQVWTGVGWDAYRAQVLADAPDLFVRLDTVAPADISGHGRTLTAYSGSWTGTTTDPTMGVVIDNRSAVTKQRARWNTSSVLTDATWTFEAVATSQNAVGSWGLIAAWNGAGAGLFSSNATAGGFMAVYDGGANAIDVPASAGWHHLCATRNGTTVTLYIDGAAVGSKTVPSTQNGTGKSVEIGTYQNDTSTWAWRGLIHSVGYYESPLTATRVLAHAAAIGLGPA